MTKSKLWQATGEPKLVIIEYLPGQQEGTLHRLENGHRTGVMWGPSVEGNWYASRAAINQGETYKFAGQRHADAFLHAPIDTDAVFTGHMHYSYRSPSGYEHFLWYHKQKHAQEAAGEDGIIIAEPCRCETRTDG